MYPASIGSISEKEAVPILEMSCSTGECEKSGPCGVMGANAMAAAIRMPPHAIKGMAYDTPVNKCCRSFCAISYTETLCIEYLSIAHAAQSILNSRQGTFIVLM